MRSLNLASCAMAAVMSMGSATAADFFAVLPPASHDPKVPTFEKVLGFGWGEEITDPDQAVRYAQALAASATGRVRLLEYGRSTEGRPLLLVVVGSPRRSRTSCRVVTPRWKPSSTDRSMPRRPRTF